MPATTEVPEWEIRPTADGHFYWAVDAAAAGDSQPELLIETLACGEENHPSHRHPSMADLLLQARKEFLEGGNRGHGDGRGFPIFQTGAERSVSVGEASIEKARCILGVAENSTTGNEWSNAANADSGFPLFSTGSGTSVFVRESSIRKAAVILDGKVMDNMDSTTSDAGAKDEVFPVSRTGLGISYAVNNSSKRKATSAFEEQCIEKESRNRLESSRNNYDSLVFSTGSGRPVTLKPSSVQKALSILDGNSLTTESPNPPKCNRSNYDSPLFSTGSGKPVTLKPSSVQKALSILDGCSLTTEQLHENIGGGNCTFYKSLFQTSSGRTVNLSTAGLNSATTLLGLEEDDKLSPKCFGHARNKPITKITKRGSLHEKSSSNMDRDAASKCIVNPANVKSFETSRNIGFKEFHSTVSYSNNHKAQKTPGDTGVSSNYAQSSVKFQTAGGRCIAISDDALNRARNLLGDPDIGDKNTDITLDQHLSLSLINKTCHSETLRNKENIPSSLSSERTNKRVLGTSSPSTKRKPIALNWKIMTDGDMLDQGKSKTFSFRNIFPENKMYAKQNYEKDDLNVSRSAENARRNEDDIPLCGPLVEISNNSAADCMDLNSLPNEKGRTGKQSSPSPFKMPRNRFITPSKYSSFLATGLSKLRSTENSCSRTSTHYAYQLRRTKIKFFNGCRTHHDLSLPLEVINMDADNALAYTFHDASTHDKIGSLAFQDMLLHLGASSSHATKEWVANHYRWIVWKFACYERCYPALAKSNFLTISNVLDELKYRYEREVNHGHRSAIKKILDGDASPASMMVLCISAIRATQLPETNKTDYTNYPHGHTKKFKNNRLTVVKSTCDTRIELTDGWYSLDAALDVCLSKQLLSGKLFVGQKLRIWGAGLCGWIEPVSPLEASKSVCLLMHINGTYRAHWAEKLGFCKSFGSPLAFSCIKVAGGKIPRTLVGVTRIYPVLYKERFPDGGYIVRSERCEYKALQQYNQSRCGIAENIMSEQLDDFADVNDCDEGAKLCKILEKAAEPDVLMAGMTSEQLLSFSAYQAKQKEVRQFEMQKRIEKALKDAGLGSRDLTPFMRVRVVGLVTKKSCNKRRFREGLITIWNPTEAQRLDLIEGKIYVVEGLVPMSLSRDVLYLRGSGSSIVWKSLPSTEAEKYELFFEPRRSIFLSNLGEIPLASEFDIAAVILHVEDACISGRQKKQWIFVSHECGCCSSSQDQEHACLLAIGFSSPLKDNDSPVLFSHHHEGTAVGFFNLVKQARDQTNRLWVAEATENSVYSVYSSLPSDSHLKAEATSAQRWAKMSRTIIQKLKERISYILGHH